MGTLIPISGGQNQLRQNRTLLLALGAASSVTGLFFWSATPFLLNSKTDRLQVALRYFSLTGTFLCGVSACVAGCQLQRISPLIKALEKAEQSDFFTQLASSQYVQQERWTQQATEEVEALQDSGYATSPPVAPALPPTSESQPEISEQPEVPPPENYRSLYKAVALLKEQGVADTKIVQNVLQRNGRSFGEGKQMLATLMRMGEAEGW